MDTPANLIPEDGFVLEFPDVSTAEAGRCAGELAADLENEILDARLGDSNTKIDRLRVRPEAQDLGTIIAIVLGAKATVALAKGIVKWLSRNNQARITIRTADGREFSISNLESKHVHEILKTVAR